MSRPRRGRVVVAAAALALALCASAVGCAGPGDAGSTTDIVVLGPTSSGAMLDELAGAYEEGHPGVRVHIVLAPTSGLADEVRSQEASIDVVVTDDAAVLDPLDARVGGRRTLGHAPDGRRMVAATLTDSQHSDLGSDVVRWLTTSPAQRVLAAHGWR